MIRTVFVVATLSAALAAVAACGGGSDDEIDPRAGRLMVGIINGEAMECYYDADVTLTADGTVGEIDRVSEAARDRIEPGMEVVGAKEVFPEGAGIPVPVHIDEDGVVRGSYAFCDGPTPAPTPPYVD